MAVDHHEINACPVSSVQELQLKCTDECYLVLRFQIRRIFPVQRLVLDVLCSRKIEVSRGLDEHVARCVFPSLTLRGSQKGSL